MKERSRGPFVFRTLKYVPSAPPATPIAEPRIATAQIHQPSFIAESSPVGERADGAGGAARRVQLRGQLARMILYPQPLASARRARHNVSGFWRRIGTFVTPGAICLVARPLSVAGRTMRAFGILLFSSLSAGFLGAAL